MSFVNYIYKSSFKKKTKTIGSENETESVSSTQNTTPDDPTDFGIIEAKPKHELDGEKKISNPETDACKILDCSTALYTHFSHWMDKKRFLF